MGRIRRRRRQVATGALIGPVAPAPAPLAVAVPPPAPPRGEGSSGGVVAFGVGIFALGLTDVGFAAYGAVKAARGERPAMGAGIAEILIAAPQAIGFNGVQVFVATELADREPGMAAFVLLPGVTNALVLHGALNSTPLAGSPVAIYGLSWAAGFDTAFTLPAIGAAVQRAALRPGARRRGDGPHRAPDRRRLVRPPRRPPGSTLLRADRRLVERALRPRALLGRPAAPRSAFSSGRAPEAAAAGPVVDRGGAGLGGAGSRGARERALVARRALHRHGSSASRKATRTTSGAGVKAMR